MVCRGIYPYAVGGVEMHSYSVSNEIAKKLQISVLFEANNTPAVELPWIQIRLKRHRNALFYLLSGLYRFIRARQYPRIVISQSAYIPMLLGLFISKIFLVSHVLVVHGSDIRTVGRSTWLKYLQKTVMLKSKWIACVSTEMREILVKDYSVDPGIVVIIPNGFDSSLLETKQKSLNAGEPKIVYIGYLRWEKDPITALHAISILRSDYPQMHFHIIGDGYLRAELEKFISERGMSGIVRLWGRIPHDQAMMVLARADIFLLSSVQEGLPTALIEAMALAKPIVATDIAATRQLISTGMNGILVSPKKPDLIASAIRMLLANQQLATEYGKKARESVRHLSWGEIVKTYFKIIERS